MNDKELQEIKEALSKATPLPWLESPGDFIDEPAAVYRLIDDLNAQTISDNMLGVDATAVTLIMNATPSLLSTIEGLKGEVERLNRVYGIANVDRKRLNDLVERYRTALEWYADSENHKYELYRVSRVFTDSGDIARKVLQGSEPC